jgi:hypothetical protein
MLTISRGHMDETPSQSDYATGWQSVEVEGAMKFS